MIKLYEHQQSLEIEILNALKLKDKVLAQADTGFGKSVLIGSLAKKLNGRTLILTHREEILEQNMEWLDGAGLLIAKKNNVKLSHEVVISMVGTLYSRLKKYGASYIGDFDNIIIDEVHIQAFDKVLQYYSPKKIVGFTATPIINKTRTLTIDGEDYSQEVTFSETYDTIVVGALTRELIDNGYLVQEYNIVLQIPNISELKDSASNPDGYTTDSLNKVYNNSVSISVLLEALKSYCVGKKTLIFNSTTRNNIKIFETLQENGYNVRMFDSVNSSEKDRKKIVEWFRNERDAVLVGTNVFTTGFNVRDIEVVIMNRATKSLAFYLQIVGRGSRTTDKIYKPYFTFIDLGMNIERFGAWSQPRNWKDYFYPNPPKLKRAYDLLNIWECLSCGYYNIVGTLLTENGDIICNDCGEKKSTKIRTKQELLGTLTPITKLPLPSGKKIIQYTKYHNESTDFAFKLLDNRILQLFIHYKITAEYYTKKRTQLIQRVGKIYIPAYFAIIKSGLKGSRKKLSTQLERIKNKIDKYFDYGEN